MRKGPDGETYLMPSEVAEIMNVGEKTIGRWAREGKLPFLRTLGGHRRFPESEIRAIRATMNVKVAEVTQQ